MLEVTCDGATTEFRVLKPPRMGIVFISSNHGEEHVCKSIAKIWMVKKAKERLHAHIVEKEVEQALSRSFDILHQSLISTTV